MYTFDSRIRYSETDETGALSLLGVINYMQDCSTFIWKKRRGRGCCLPGGSLLTDIRSWEKG